MPYSTSRRRAHVQVPYVDRRRIGHRALAHGNRAASLLQAAHGMLATMTTQLTPQLARTLVQERGRRLPPRRTAVRWRTGRRARDDLAPDHVASPAAYGA
jgi:hypothetical protein